MRGENNGLCHVSQEEPLVGWGYVDTSSPTDVHSRISGMPKGVGHPSHEWKVFHRSATDTAHFIVDSVTIAHEVSSSAFRNNNPLPTYHLRRKKNNNMGEREEEEEK